MHNRTSTTKRLMIAVVVAVQISFLPAPLSLVAQESDATADTSTEASTTSSESVSGTTSPTGSDSHTYSYNPEAGLWENQYYTWNPVTKVTKPKYNTSYVYNESNGLWEKTHWYYSAAAGAFKKRVTTSETDPYAPATITDTGANSSNTIENPDGEATISNTGEGSNNEIKDAEGPTSITNTGQNSNNEANIGSINNTGAESNNIIGYDKDGNAVYDVDNKIAVNNNINSTATSGNALVLQNTNGGNATTGDAYVEANVINMVQSALGVNDAMPNLYTANIYGDYYGDITINPELMTANSNGCGCYDNLTVNSETDTSINNDLNLAATSGDAKNNYNTNGGDATTGDATVVANVVNMINSAIMSGESFIGILNVHGNLEGDVLVADDVIDELIAANVPTVEVCLCDDSKQTYDIDNSTAIDTNVDASATSGSATVSKNTNAGNATSGDANTNVTVFNLTGQHVMAESAMLVFVNVLGEWVGFITNAPQGATAALLGNGYQPATAPTSQNTNVDIDNNFTINNDIDAAATTGNAEVIGNTNGGNATSGDANTAVNVANITNSTIGLNNWFGLLFINVMGDWHGSFGTNTAFGGAPQFPIIVPDPELSGALNESHTVANAAATPSATTDTQSSSVRAYQITSSQNEDGTVAIQSMNEVDAASLGAELVNTAQAADTEPMGLGVIVAVSAAALMVLFGDRIVAVFRTRFSS